MPDGPLPEECQLTLLRLKYSILAMIFFAFGPQAKKIIARMEYLSLSRLSSRSSGNGPIGRVVCAIALGAGAVSFDVIAFLNMFLSIVMGTFLLKDDQHLRGFYKCLAETICQVCADSGPGGMQCLIPFMILTLIEPRILDLAETLASKEIQGVVISLAITLHNLT